MQDNDSFSAQRGTVRGLHFQVPPFPQHKLVRVVRGAIFDVAVDLRRGSTTRGPALGIQWPVSAGEAVLSERDTKWPRLAELANYFD